MDLDKFRSLSRFADDMLRPSETLREQLRLYDAATSQIRDALPRASIASQMLADLGYDRIRELQESMQLVARNENLRGMIEGSSTLARAVQGHIGSPTMRAALGYIDSPSTPATMGYIDSQAITAARRLVDDRMTVAVRELAERAQALSMPPALAGFQTSVQSLAERMSLLETGLLSRDGIALEVFARSAAMSDAIALASRVDHGLIEAARAFSSMRMPELGSFAAHRAFLDASGLWLPRWPRRRLLTAAEKRRRFRARLQRNAEPPHVRRAKSLVHRYELVLREIIDASMAATYGEDWAEDRLPRCDCKTLLGRAASRGGNPLDHADYAHYRLIMSHPEHHADVFCVAFDDPDTLAKLIDDAGRLRARSHHPHDFLPDDLRDLRVVWRTIEAGLLALTSDFEVDYLD